MFGRTLFSKYACQAIIDQRTPTLPWLSATRGQINLLDEEAREPEVPRTAQRNTGRNAEGARGDGRNEINTTINPSGTRSSAAVIRAIQQSTSRTRKPKMVGSSATTVQRNSGRKSEGARGSGRNEQIQHSTRQGIRNNTLIREEEGGRGG